MNTELLLKTYLEGLNTGDAKLIVDLFEPDGIVYSPLYGEMNPKDFYKDLFSDTSQSKTTLIDVFKGKNTPYVNVYFKYDWTLKDGTIYPFYCVDVFEVSSNNKFKSLRIIYDTAGVRDTFENLD